MQNPQETLHPLMDSNSNNFQDQTNVDEAGNKANGSSNINPFNTKESSSPSVIRNESFNKDEMLITADSDNQSKVDDIEGKTVTSAARTRLDKDSVSFNTTKNKVVTSAAPSSITHEVVQSPSSLTSSFKNLISDQHESKSPTRARFRKAAWGARLAGGSMQVKDTKSAVNESTTFPLLGSALAVPEYYFNFDHKHHLPAIILEAFKLEVTDSHTRDDHVGNEHDVFRLELEYGSVKWVVYRHLYDFYRLHYHLKKSYLIGKIQSYPRFPNQLSYAFHRATSFSPDDISQLTLQRRKDLESYLVEALKMLSMQTLRELYEFLEVGGSSIRPFMGWKGREGYLSLRNSKTNELGCFPAIFGRWSTCWVMLRDSYVVVCRSVLDTKPADVFLFNRFTKLDESFATSRNPLSDNKIAIADLHRRIDFKVEYRNEVPFWTNHLEYTLKESPFTKEHRFGSFAPIRTGISAKYYVDGSGYFRDVAEAILKAKDCIFIADWWLSPEIYLRRPPSQYPEYRLDRLLLKKAEEGVDIYVLVYKEVSVSLPNDSQYTKRTLKKLHRNIKVQRHPDHVQTNGTWFWAHHEKIVVVDHRKAFLGGLDLCFGRFDDNSHRLADYNPLSDGKDTIFPGQDYSNARIRDNYDVHNASLEVIDRKSYPRMPWHDISVQISGSAARDAARHFIERWNFIKTSKAKQREKLPFLMPQGETSTDRAKLETEGTCQVQVLRSSSEWSSGVEKENSVYTAYIDSIGKAQRFIYIENQFFVSAAYGDPNYTVKNKIAKALVDRILLAAKHNSPFKVIVVMPLMPAFQSELHDSGANTIRLVMQWQYQSICRGKESVFGQLRENNINPHDYIYFHGLRNYDLIPQSHKHQPENEVIATPLALSPGSSQHLDLANNQSPRSGEFDLGNQDPDSVNRPPVKQKSGSTYKSLKYSRDNLKGMFDSFRSNKNHLMSEDESSDDDMVFPTFAKGAHSKKKDSVIPELSPKAQSNFTGHPELAFSPLVLDSPTSLDESNRAPSVPNAPNAPNAPTEPTRNQPLNAESTEAASQYVTEQVYIHSKLMIVDDRLVICGSANINDRSMLGYRDSEIAVIIEDQDMIPSTMAGQEFQVSRFAYSLRTTIFKEHLGLLSGTEMVNLINWEASDSPGAASSSAPVEDKLEFDYHPDDLIKDPLSDSFTRYWRNVASLNTRAFREVFRVVPDDSITNWDSYRDFIPNPDRVVTGHPDFRTILPSQVQHTLDKIRGHLVEFPSKFLEEESFSVSAFSAESMIPLDVFI